MSSSLSISSLFLSFLSSLLSFPFSFLFSRALFSSLFSPSLHFFSSHFLLSTMEDDGMMLNFAAPTGPVEPKKTKVTGGNWRERRKMQLLLEGRQKAPGSGVNSLELKNDRIRARERPSEKRSENSNEKSNRNEKPNRSVRREVTSSEDKPDSSRTTKRTTEPIHGPTAKKIRFSESNGEFGGKNNTYVSSLFTSNQLSLQLVASGNGTANTFEPSNAPLKDASTFNELGINDKLSKHLHETLRFKAPTKVQRAVLPRMLAQERDLFVRAQTGSGKTLSFLLPIFDKLMQSDVKRDSGLFAVVLTPTRELASQIYLVMETLARCCHHIVPGIVIGGEKKKSEKARLRKGVNILVATPGRLADHIENTSSLDIGQLRWLVLDEGDKLVELGFEETITKITDHITRNSRIMDSMYEYPELPTKRVNVLCSATIQNNVEKLGSILLKNPEMVAVESIAGTTSFESPASMTAPDQLVQSVVVVPPKLRLVTLAASLLSSSSRTIVFFSCSDLVNFHFDVFTRGGKSLHQRSDDDDGDAQDETVGAKSAPMLGSSTNVFKLHGSLTQAVRTSTLQAFVNSKLEHSVLFCTDVASRGLDMPDISSVIEYDPPFTVDDHLHRIGRSARVGKDGRAMLFLLPGAEESYVDGKLRVVHPKEENLRVVNYEDILKEGFAEEDEEEDKSQKKKKKDPKSKEGKWDIHATTWHLEVERWLLEDSAAHALAVQGFTSHVRAYATHLSGERSFFNVRLLHLGHLAKSFGLRETPKKLGKEVGKEGGGKKKEDPRKKMLRMAKRAATSASDEFNY